MKETMGMDWIDGVLISGMFVLGISISTFIPGLEHFADNIAIVGVFGAPLVRRYFFGPPKYQHPKEGFVYSLSSLLGLFLMFLSMGLFWLASIAIQHSLEPEPNFRAEVEASDRKWREAIDDIDIGMPIPVGTPQEEIDRLEKEQDEKAEQERLESIEVQIKEEQQRFRKDKAERQNDGIQLSLYALLVCAFGGILLRIRYPFSTPTE